MSAKIFDSQINLLKSIKARYEGLQKRLNELNTFMERSSQIAGSEHIQIGLNYTTLNKDGYPENIKASVPFTKELYNMIEPELKSQKDRLEEEMNMLLDAVNK